MTSDAPNLFGGVQCKSAELPLLFVTVGVCGGPGQVSGSGALTKIIVSSTGEAIFKDAFASVTPLGEDATQV